MTEALASAIKLAIRGLIREAESAPNPYVKIVALLAEVGLEAYPYVKAYSDPPKTLEELQNAVQSPSEVGYEDHHIVEKNTANPDGSEDALIEAPDNLARIPTAKRWKLNGWYQTPNFERGGMTPIEYLPGKSWDERRRVGLIGLRYIGILK